MGGGLPEGGGYRRGAAPGRESAWGASAPIYEDANSSPRASTVYGESSPTANPRDRRTLLPRADVRPWLPG